MSKFEDPKALESWFGRVVSDRAQTDTTRQEIADHMLGTRDFTTTRSPGRVRTEAIYDTTAMESHELLSGAIYGMLTNPAADWFDFELDDPRLKDELENALWLEDAKRKMLREFATAASNFASQIAEAYLDITGFGMCGLSLLGRDRGGLSFTAHPLSTIYLDTNQRNEVDVRFRTIDLSARQWATRWPNHVTKAISAALTAGDSQSKFCARQIIAPSDDPMAGRSSFRKPWTSVYWTAQDTPAILEAGGFDENPLLTPRWKVESGEKYGRSPAWTALPTAMMLNEMQRTILVAGQKAADPPLLVTNESILSQLNTDPGSVNIVQQIFGQAGAGEPIRPLVSGGNHQLTVELIRLHQSAVKAKFHGQLLALFEDPRMSATQVLELAQQIQRLMAPILVRMQQELLEPMLDRGFNLMLRGGRFLPIPTGLRGQTLHITYVSPVTRSQRQADARAVLETWQGAAVIAQATGRPDAFDVLDADESVRILHRANNAPSRMLRDAQSLLASREQRAAQEQGASQLAALGQGAEIVQRLGQAFAATQPVARAA